VKQIQGSSHSPSVKNGALLGIYKSFQGTDLIKASLLSSVAKNALELNDVDTMIKISDEHNAPAAVQKTLAKMAKKASGLEFQQSSSLLKIIEKPGVDDKALKNIVEAYKAKAATQTEVPR